MGKKEIYDSFSKPAAFDNISSIKANELIITQSALGPVVIAEYQVVVPLMGNVSALLDFYAATDE
jgi:hypothetical protein